MNDINVRILQKRERIHQSHRLDEGQPALIVIDMQHGFLDEGASLEIPAGRAVLPNVVNLVETCRQNNVPVVFTEFVYATSVPCLRGEPFGPEHLPHQEGEPTGYTYPSNNCLVGPGAGEGVESADTVEQLAPAVDELVIRGHTYDKFYGTHLDLALRSLNIDRLLMTGVTTDVCVNSTLISAATRNYRVTAVTDGMATIEDRIHQACLDIWQNKFARLASSDEVAEEIKRRTMV